MASERQVDTELAESVETLRRELAEAKERVRHLYRDARIRLALNTGQWLVVDAATGVTIEASDSLETLASGKKPATTMHPESGTHRRMDDKR
jgi:hypothetical protein